MTKTVVATCVAVIYCLTIACTTARPVMPPGTTQQIRLQIHAGDIVRVHTKDGANHSIRVTEIRAASLAGVTAKRQPGDAEASGAVIEISYGEIERLEVRRFSVLKTSALVVAGIVVVAVAAAAFGSCSPKNCPTPIQ